MSSFWGIQYDDDLLDKDGETRRMVRMVKEIYGLDVPQALAKLVKAGFPVLVSTPLPSMKAKNTRKSGPPQHRPVDREAA
jgi:hypothetical protein